METPYVWDVFRELSESLTETAVSHPGQVERLNGMLEALSEVGEHLPLYRGFRVIVSLCRRLRELREDDPEWQPALDHYAREFDAALSGAEVSGRERDISASLSEELNEGEFEAHASGLRRSEFVENVVCPVAFGKSYDEARRPAYETFVPQEDRRTGRVTVGYRFEGGVLVFGKVYPSSEPHAFEVLQRVRATGFGEGPYQAVEPLAFLPDHNFLLTGAVQGVSLLNFIGEEGPEALENVRRAARWLVKMHRLPLRIGPQETEWRSMKLFSILRRLTRVAALKPQERDGLIEKMERLCRKAGEKRQRPPVVQVHGSFHYEHIYVSEAAVSVIDFDQSFPSDPARDLTFFLTTLRRRTFKRTGGLATAHGPTKAFLDEYISHLPENMLNLDVYWGAAILFDLFHYKKKEGQDEGIKPLIAFLEDDYDAVLSGELIGGLNEGF